LTDLIKLSVKSPSLAPTIPSAFTPYPLFSVVLLQSKEILLNLSMKCRNSAFNAQGSRVIIVVVQVRALKIYVEAIEACQERGDETQFTTTTKIKLVEKLVFGSQLYIFVL